MRVVPAFEAKNTFGTLLDQVERGEEILVTRHGRPVARLVPHQPKYNRAAAEAAMERIRARARARGLGPFKWEEWKSLRDEGRP